MIFAINYVLVSTGEKGEQTISDGDTVYMSTKQPAFECRDDRTQLGGYGRLLLVPGIPRICDNRGFDMYNIFKGNTNIEREIDLYARLLSTS